MYVWISENTYTLQQQIKNLIRHSKQILKVLRINKPNLIQENKQFRHVDLVSIFQFTKIDLLPAEAELNVRKTTINS